MGTNEILTNMNLNFKIWFRCGICSFRDTDFTL